MLQALLLSLFNVYELFLASALTTQVAVSVAVVAVSSAVVYYCQHRGYANYITLGLLFGGWRATGEPLDTGGGGDDDGGGVLKTYISPGDGAGGGPHGNRDQEIAGAVRALISVVPGRDIEKSNVSREGVLLLSSSSDKRSKEFAHRGGTQRTLRPIKGVTEGTEDFGQRTNIAGSGATKQYIHSENVEYEWEEGTGEKQMGSYDDEEETICERQELEAHLQGKTLVTEKRQEKSHEFLASAQRNTSDLAGNVTLLTLTRPVLSSKKEGTGTKPKHVLSYLDPNEGVKSLHRTTGRLNVRSSGQHNPHALVECSKQTAAKIDRKLRPVKSASEESCSKFESGVHTQKSDFSMGQLKPDVCRLLQEGITLTDLTSTKHPDSSVAGGGRRSSAPVPLIHIFKSDSQSTENEHDSSHRLSLSDTTLAHLPTMQSSVSLEVPPVFVGHHVSYSQAICEATREEDTSHISTGSLDGTEAGADSDSCVAEVEIEEMFTGPPVSTEEVPVSEIPLPSFVITAPDTGPDDEMNEVPEQVTMAASDSLGVPSVCTSELVVTKPTQCVYVTTQTHDTTRTSSALLAPVIIPEIRTIEVSEPAPVVCAEKRDVNESENESGQFTRSSLISWESLEVPSVDTVKEAYPKKRERRPPDIEMSSPPQRPILKCEVSPPSPTSPTKRKSVKFSQSVVGGDDDGDDGDDGDCYDDGYSPSEHEHIKRPRLQRDDGIDIPDLNGSEKTQLQRRARGTATTTPTATADVKTRFTQSSTTEAMLFFTEKALGSSDSSDSSDKQEFIFGQKSDVTFKTRFANSKSGGGDGNECNQPAAKDGAKSRFLEVTQNEGRSHYLLTATITTSTSSESNSSEDNVAIETEDAKSRFLQTSDAAKSSLLLSKTITGSVESTSDDTTVCTPMPILEEAEQNVSTSSGDGAIDAEGESERLDVDGESAKSRFMESCCEPENIDSEECLDVERSDGYGEGKTREPSRWKSEANTTWRNALEDELADDIEFYESSDDEAEDETEGTTARKLGESDGSVTTRTHRSDAATSKIDCFSPWYNKAVVLDNGSDVLKVGLAGDYLPSTSIPTLVGRMRDSVERASSKETNTFVGDDALANQGILAFDYPIEDGIIDNWSDMERIWDHVFTYELDLSPSEHPVLITEIATAPREQRQKYLEVMFERFHVPAVFLSNQAVLSLHASGYTSGVVLSSGSGVTELVPIYEGFTISHAVSVLDIAGREVTRQLARLLQFERGYNFTTSSEWEILRIMKERLSYVALDCEDEKRRAKVVEAHEYKLPDGQTMKVSNELFQCAESLFDPSIVGITHQSGIHMLVKESLQRCDPEIRALLKDVLLLSGGNTKLKGFLPRLQEELRGLNLNMSVSAPTERDNSAWIGGSILASHSSFMDRWVTVDEYADQGEQIVHRKCF